MAEPEVFLDTNVVLDHLMDRQPFAEHAHRIFALADWSQTLGLESPCHVGEGCYGAAVSNRRRESSWV